MVNITKTLKIISLPIGIILSIVQILPFFGITDSSALYNHFVTDDHNSPVKILIEPNFIIEG